MENGHGSGFRISSGNSDLGEPGTSSRRTQAQISKLGRRVNWFFFLCLILLGAGLALGYYEMQRQLAAMQLGDTGRIVNRLDRMEAQTEEMIGQYEGLQDAYEELEKGFNQKVLPLDEILVAFENTSRSIKDRLGELEQKSAELEASRPDPEAISQTIEKKLLERLGKELTREFTQYMDQIDKRLEPLKGLDEQVKALKTELESLQKEVEAVKVAQESQPEPSPELQAEIEALDEKYAKQLVEIVNTLEKATDQFNKVQKDLSGVLTRSAMNRALADQKKQLQGEMKAIMQSLQAKDKRIDALERQLLQLRKGSSQPGGFIEQDIQ